MKGLLLTSKVQWTTRQTWISVDYKERLVRMYRGSVPLKSREKSTTEIEVESSVVHVFRKNFVTSDKLILAVKNYTKKYSKPLFKFRPVLYKSTEIVSRKESNRKDCEKN